MNIDDCRGGRITLGGDIKFEGQVREIYWTFITPCLQDLIQDVLRETEDAGRRYKPNVQREALAESADMLTSFVARVYRRMVDIDRRLRGRGRPSSVKPYDPSAKIDALNRLIEDQVGSLREQIAVASWPRSLFQELARPHTLWPSVATIAAGLLAALLAALL